MPSSFCAVQARTEDHTAFWRLFERVVSSSPIKIGEDEIKAFMCLFDASPAIRHEADRANDQFDVLGLLLAASILQGHKLAPKLLNNCTADELVAIWYAIEETTRARQQEIWRDMTDGASLPVDLKLPPVSGEESLKVSPHTNVLGEWPTVASFIACESQPVQYVIGGRDRYGRLRQARVTVRQWDRQLEVVTLVFRGNPVIVRSTDHVTPLDLKPEDNKPLSECKVRLTASQMHLDDVLEGCMHWA